MTHRDKGGTKKDTEKKRKTEMETKSGMETQRNTKKKNR